MVLAGIKTNQCRPRGSEYEQLLHQGVMVLQLHSWEAHGHQYLGGPTSQLPGNGVEDVQSAYGRALRADANILEALVINQNANDREFWLKDPDAHIVAGAGRTGDPGD
ncbi:MAG: glyoxalase [Acidobacteriales bacterium]|nr:glyoxalase [Terriglobales bacterium]